MSYEIDIREELIIHNVNERTGAAVARLADYIRQFNKMDGLSAMQIYSMELVADEKIAWVDDEISSKECGYIFTDDANGRPLVKLIEEDYTHWDEEEDVPVILKELENAREITLRMDCSLLVTSETSYGVAYWQEYLERMEPEGFGEHVTYRSAEFYTANDPVCFYMYADGKGQTPMFHDGISEDFGQRSWYSYCLLMHIEGLDMEKVANGEKAGDGEKIADERRAGEHLAAIVDAFSEKYGLETTSADIADDHFFMEEELGLPEGGEEAFLSDLQRFADFAGEASAVFSLRAEFFSDGGDFEFLSIGEEEGQVRARSCRF